MIQTLFSGLLWWLVAVPSILQVGSLSTVHTQTIKSKAALSSLGDALADPTKEITQLQEQLDPDEKDLKEEKDLNNLEITDYKMKVQKLELELEEAYVANAQLKDKLVETQSELKQTQAELRLSQGNCKGSHVENVHMQKKVLP